MISNIPNRDKKDINKFYNDRHIRVFISSTFIDMQAERDELVKRIFPQLRKLCEQRGVEWSEVDLRWGVSDEEKAEGKVLPICLAEINNCRPYFIGLLGERYGWVAKDFPEDIIKTFPWLSEFKGRSITELEMVYGVLRNPELAGKAFFYFRDPSYLRNLPEDIRKSYDEIPTEEELREDPLLSLSKSNERRDKLNSLKNQIRESGVKVRENYKDPKALGDIIFNDFKNIIDELFPENKMPSELDKENIEQKLFINNRTKFFLGKQTYIDSLFDVIMGNESGIMLTGNAGSGKSALLAYFAQLIEKDYPLVIHNFAGSTEQSNNPESILKRFINNINNVIKNSNSNIFKGIKEFTIPDRLSKLISEFNNALYVLSSRCKIIIILDAVNQLEENNASQYLVWLPEILPDNVKIIASTINGPPLTEAIKRKWRIINLDPLTSEEINKFVVQYLHDKYRKKLSDKQVANIAKSNICSNPLALTILLEELRVYGDHFTIDKYLAYYLSSITIDDLLNKLFNRYEKDYETDYPELVKKSLSLLCLSRNGLKESELLSILGKSYDEPLPKSIWSPFYIAIDYFLINKAGLLTISHNNIKYFIENKYLSIESDINNFRHIIIKYFRSRIISQRKIAELPYQLYKLKNWEALSSELSIPNVFLSLYSNNKYEVHEYWNQIETQSHITCKKIYNNFVLEVKDGTINMDNEYLIHLFGDFFNEKGAYDEAINAYTVIAKYHQRLLFERIDAPDNLQKILSKIVEVFVNMGDYEAAITLNQSVIQLALSPYDFAIDAMSVIIPDKLNKSVNNVLFNKFKVIIGNVIKLSKYFLNISNIGVTLASSISDNGEICYRQGNFSQALSSFKIASYLYNNSMYRFIESILYYLKLMYPINYFLLFLIYRSHKRTITELSNNSIVNFIKYFADINKLYLARSFMCQAKALMKMNKISDSLNYYKKAELYLLDINAKYDLCEVYRKQAEIFFKQDNTETALLLYRKVERICRETGNREILLESLEKQLQIITAINPEINSQPIQEEINYIVNTLTSNIHTQNNNATFRGTMPFSFRRMQLLKNIYLINSYISNDKFDLSIDYLDKTIDNCYTNLNDDSIKKIGNKINDKINSRIYNMDVRFYLFYSIFLSATLFSKTVIDNILMFPSYYSGYIFGLLYLFGIIYSSIYVTNNKTSLYGLFVAGLTFALILSIIAGFINSDLYILGYLKLNLLNIIFANSIAIFCIYLIVTILVKVFKINDYKIDIKYSDKPNVASPDYEMIRACHKLKSNIYLKRKQYNLAYLMHLRNIKLCRYETDTTVILNSYYSIIVHLIDDLKEYERAFLYINDYIILSTKYNNEYTLANAYYLKGFAEKSTGNKQSAIRDLKYSCDLLFKLRKNYNLINACFCITEIYNENNNYSYSLELLNKCKDLCLEIDNDILLSKIYLKEFSIYFLTSDFINAAKLESTLVDLYAKLDDNNMLGCLYVDFSYVNYMLNGDTHQTCDKLENALKYGYSDYNFINNTYKDKLIHNDFRFNQILESIKAKNHFV